jgi:hypothetical protein
MKCCKYNQLSSYEINQYYINNGGKKSFIELATTEKKFKITLCFPVPC